ncbi:TPA: DNA topoisomerase III [Streptococcus agalactiae]
MKLVIAEKPSVAVTIAKVIGARTRKNGYYEGNGYIVSWCVGHLIQMASPEIHDEKWKKWTIDTLPIIPEEYIYEVSKSTRKQYGVLKKLLNDKNINTVINACDAGREGELIFRLVYNQAKCKKKIQRLWISSMENKAIEDGFRNLKDGENFEDLYRSANARAIADWLVGMNLSRLYSCIYKETYSIGRVQTPTLYLIAKRDSEINLFKKQKYYTVDLSYGGLKLVSDRIDKIEVAEQLLNLLEDEIVITEVEDKEISTKPDKPYDLTTLQREANKYFGYSANDTLNLAQGLYEKKLITYPRTDSRYLTDDMVNTMKELLEGLEEDFKINESNFKSIFNSSKVTDHYAIIPTISGIGKAKDLSDKESKIYNLIKNKLLASCSDNLKESSRKIRYEYDKFNFNASGKTVIDEGYTKYLKSYGKERQENELPDVKTGDKIKLTSKNISEKFTKAPSHYNEDTLLKAMESAGVESLDKDIEVERKGLGTPATRAGIIENLIHKDLIRRDKKNLLVTEKGNRLVSIVEDKFKSAETTSEWENVKGVLDRNMRDSFFIYLKELENLGYESKYEILNAMDFGIPQKRERIFVVSCLGANNFSFNKLERKETRALSEFLEKDVSELYTMTQPYMLKFLNKGIDNSFKGRLKVIKDFSYTISTKQMRVPNSGIIDIGNGQYRYLTERECLRLMGFDDSDINKLEEAHPRRKNCTSSKLYKQAGNSIVVDVLMELINSILFYK